MPLSKRINIVLPEATLRTIRRIVKPGLRSRFINEAVEHYVAYRSPEALRERLERAVIRDRDLDSEVAADWSAVDSEVWNQLDIPEKGRKPATRGGAKPGSRRSTHR